MEIEKIVGPYRKDDLSDVEIKCPKPLERAIPK